MFFQAVEKQANATSQVSLTTQDGNTTTIGQTIEETIGKNYWGTIHNESNNLNRQNK